MQRIDLQTSTYPLPGALDSAEPLYQLIRPLLFQLDAEDAHRAVMALLRLAGSTLSGRAAMRMLFPAASGHSPVEVFGLRFPNPVGLAAGFDKDATAWRALALLGFGHIEIGTVTPRPQPGNPRPRIFRLVEDGSLINRMGFPSQGADAVARRLAAKRPRGAVLGVNIGKNKDTPLEAVHEDYLTLLRTFAPLADYLAVNVSSPNTPGLRSLQAYQQLYPLLSALTAERARLRADLNRPVPILVKLAPDLASRDLDAALQAILDSGADGAILSNTSTRRDWLASPAQCEPGGLSGMGIQGRSTELVRAVHQRTGGRLPVIASGGIMSPADAQAKLDAGAALVQVYTGLIFQGPGLPRRIAAGVRPQASVS